MVHKASSATDVRKKINRQNLDHFCKLARAGRHSGCSAGELAAHRIAKVILDEYSLDQSALNGMLQFALRAGVDHHLAAQVVGIEE